ncbi:hypothetical protein Dsin_022762 [Dipteronia sinensis]|uniref:RRM domain-containing protein n=1 Tax=Dipteronia sinensis TaxID=43782 RepID=A0AAE0E1G0_9ROSI|nr:hypothetical protein Dsin_022762 [Dipteronia sinensis]
MELTFGKVRDIYLAAANGVRKRGFAFVRFATMEEARKVAEMTNEMHVYGWPISTKVVQYGWNKRRMYVSRVSRVENWNRRERMNREDKFRGLDGSIEGNMGHRSFVEAVISSVRKDEAKREERNDDYAFMALDKRVSDRKWLEHSVLGELKEFSSFLIVNKRLSYKGFYFTTKYMGGKMILWCFGS